MKLKRLWFWILVAILGLYFVARAAAQLAIYAGWLNLGLDSDITSWFAGDLRIVVDAAARLAERRDLYPADKWMKSFNEYNYTPAYALFISQIAARVSFNVHALCHGLVSLAAYAALFFSWRRLFPRLGLPAGAGTLVGILPLWLLYAAWWGDFILLNIYILLALTVSWLFYLLWKDRLWLPALLLILILQVKPQWGFALVLPLLLGRFRSFAKLLAVVAAGYIVVAGVTILWLGPDYGLSQYSAYYKMLATAAYNIPWHGPGEYIGYDHSIAQIYFFLFGYTNAAWPLIWLIKLALLAPLAVIAIRLARQNYAQPQRVQPALALECFFALYLASFIWLDLVWEITLSIVVFIYLMTVLTKRWQRWLVAAPFGWYALVDLWQIIGGSIAASIPGEAEAMTAAQRLPLWVDPSFHIPIIMMVILSCYGILASRLFSASQAPLKP